MNKTYLDQVLGQILDYGMTSMCEPGRPGRTVPYAYTVGLTAYDDHPELLILALPCQLAHPILTSIGDQVVAGLRLKPGDQVDGVLAGGYPLMIAGPVTPDDDHLYPLSMARAVFMHAGPPLQVVFPDDSYRFPWDRGYDMDMTQPLLAPALRFDWPQG